MDFHSKVIYVSLIVILLYTTWKNSKSAERIEVAMKNAEHLPVICKDVEFVKNVVNTISSNYVELKEQVQVLNQDKGERDRNARNVLGT